MTAEAQEPVRRGVWLYPGAPAAALVDAVIRAEELGLDEVWIADEGVAREPIPVLAAAAMATDRIRLGVGITSPLLRHPGAVASTVATLDELSGGRAVLGLGVGGEQALEPFMLSTDRPVGMLREAIDTARAVLARRAGDGYRPPAHAMPAREVPIWVGARGPQLIDMAARHADGLFLSGCTPAEHERIVGAARAAGTPQVALYASASDDDDRPSVARWGDVASNLSAELARHRPDAIGINLVDLMRGHETVGLVETAAAALRLVPSPPTRAG